MCPSSWNLYVDGFPFFGSSLAHIEPELELFEVWEIVVLQIIIHHHHHRQCHQLQTALAQVLDELGPKQEHFRM